MASKQLIWEDKIGFYTVKHTHTVFTHSVYVSEKKRNEKERNMTRCGGGESLL